MTTANKKTITNNKNFLINDHGRLIKIKQPTIMELKLLYLAIMENKRITKAVFNFSDYCCI